MTLGKISRSNPQKISKFVLLGLLLGAAFFAVSYVAQVHRKKEIYRDVSVNLQIIWGALQCYDDMFGNLPAPAHLDESGFPLSSWRFRFFQSLSVLVYHTILTQIGNQRQIKQSYS